MLISDTSCTRNTECLSRLSGCCTKGWRVVLAGSRFLELVESRYAPIEGIGLSSGLGLGTDQVLHTGKPRLSGDSGPEPEFQGACGISTFPSSLQTRAFCSICPPHARNPFYSLALHPSCTPHPSVLLNAMGATLLSCRENLGTKLRD